MDRQNSKRFPVTPKRSKKVTNALWILLYMLNHLLFPFLLNLLPSLQVAGDGGSSSGSEEDLLSESGPSGLNTTTDSQPKTSTGSQPKTSTGSLSNTVSHSGISGAGAQGLSQSSGSGAGSSSSKQSSCKPQSKTKKTQPPRKVCLLD